MMKLNGIGKLRTLLAGSALALVMSSAVSAQEVPAKPTAPAAADAPAHQGLEEIIVTARRREENLQSTPISITALSQATLQARNITDLTKLSAIAPNLQLYNNSGSVGVAGIFLRGIGYADNVLGQDSPVGIYIDGVYSGRVNAATLDMVAPDRVEVLRGPQGTLFGRNTTGGAISVTTHNPTQDFSGEVRGSYGTFNSKRLQARVDTGEVLNSGIRLSFAYQHRQQDGTVNSGLEPSYNDPGADRSDAFWAKAVGEWGKLTATLSADHTDDTGRPGNLQIVAATAATKNMLALSPTYGGGSYTVTTTPQFNIPNSTSAGDQHVKDQGVALTLNYKASPALTIKSISAFRGFDRNDPAAYGPSNLEVNTGSIAVPKITTFNGLYNVPLRISSDRQFSQELQALGSLGDFDYVAGLFYLKEDAKENSSTRLAFPSGTGATGFDVTSFRNYTIAVRSKAAFAQANWRPSIFNDKLEITGGIRYTHDTRGYVATLPVVRDLSIKNNNVSYLASVNYKWTPEFMTYVRYATGYRAGGFNVRAAAGVDPAFLPEKLKGVEGGFKLEAFDRKLRLNGAGFYNKYSNLQVTQFAVPGASGTGGNGAVNANANYSGFELELDAVPVDGLTLNAALAHVHQKYTDYPRPLTAGAVDPGCTGVNNSGGKLVSENCAAVTIIQPFPTWSLDVGASYVLPATSYGKWSVRADYTYKNKINWGSFNLPSVLFNSSITQPGYGLLSGRIALSDIPLGTGGTKAQISVYGDNLTNKHYIGSAVDFGYFATIVYGVRRSVGVEAKVDF